MKKIMRMETVKDNDENQDMMNMIYMRNMTKMMW